MKRNSSATSIRNALSSPRPLHPPLKEARGPLEPIDTLGREVGPTLKAGGASGEPGWPVEVDAGFVILIRHL